MKNLIYLKDVVTVKLDADKCTGCGICMQVCPHDVFALNAKKANIISKDACMECGACQMNCPSGAISVDVGVGYVLPQSSIRHWVFKPIPAAVLLSLRIHRIAKHPQKKPAAVNPSTI